MKAKCPHCGELFKKLLNSEIPTHDFPKPCRSVCPGSGERPRPEKDERPLWKDDPQQRATDFYNGCREELLLYGFGVVKQVATLRGQTHGFMDCPLCQNAVKFSIAASNGHCCATCETEGCINAME